MFIWRYFRAIVGGLTSALLFGPVMAVPLSSDDASGPWRDWMLEQMSDRQLPVTPLSVGDATLRADAETQSVPGQQTARPGTHRRVRDAQASEDLIASLNATVHDGSTAVPQTFWRHADSAKSMPHNELPQEFIQTFDDLQRGVAESISEATGMRVDSEGRRRLSFGGVEIFMGPQGGGVAINNGDLSQVLIDYDAKRNDAELAMLADQEASGGGRVTFNPLVQIVRWLEEILTYPLFWVFVATLVFGYVATMIIRQRGLKRAQELYAKGQRLQPLGEIDRKSSPVRRTSSGHAAKPNAQRPAVNQAAGKNSRSEAPQVASPAVGQASPTIPDIKQMPTNRLRTGSIWLKR